MQNPRDAERRRAGSARPRFRPRRARRRPADIPLTLPYTRNPAAESASEQGVRGYVHEDVVQKCDAPSPNKPMRPITIR